jgi:hypothetical protein
MTTLHPSFRRLTAPGTGRAAIQLTEGDATCYPLYYFIPSLTDDGRTLIYHRAGQGEVQLYKLDLGTGESVQLTHGSAPETRWIPWCVESGRGILDHRSVLDPASGRVIYFDGNDVRLVNARPPSLGAPQDRRLFKLPEDRVAVGQNCFQPGGRWFVYIHHDRDNFQAVYNPDGPRGRHLSRGAALAAYNLATGEHRTLLYINSPIHHVLPYDEQHVVFCHPTRENGMLLTDLRGGWYTHLRTQDERGGCVCHYNATARGLMYEVLGRPDAVWSGMYNPSTHNRYEFQMPARFGYTHTGSDPDGLLWFYENHHRPTDQHDLHFLVRHDPGSEDEWLALTGNWPTYGRGQKAHFHPRLTPDRRWILMTSGDPRTLTNHIYLLDVSDLSPTEGIAPV